MEKKGQLLEAKIKEKFPHLSNRKIAELAGMSPASFQNLINRGYTNASVANMLKIARMLEIDIYDLFPEIVKNVFPIERKKRGATEFLLMREKHEEKIKAEDMQSSYGDEETDFNQEQNELDEQDERSKLMAELSELHHPSYKYLSHDDFSMNEINKLLPFENLELVMKKSDSLPEDIFYLKIFNGVFSVPFHEGTYLICSRKFDGDTIFELDNKKILIKYKNNFSIRKVKIIGDTAVLVKTSLREDEYDIPFTGDVEIIAYGQILYSVSLE